ncbi:MULTISPECIES: SDR family NAD(P)-dependent oxidoreductase [Actinoalloteichus]|uniref:Dehydrogenase n=1 Tax=Actinoalloteichus fjordicus TaxID=1612552 RepID=A0AAC9LH85_9PSEU|nr:MULTISPECIES: SDR family NAD(P)-dependent oxidoreductase [Actinoalloteichus]APU16845.1 dehydrogenase of unknown specificity, short-chain alcohol dehydrogenase like [Actinoalloteichus fjordicus]APU22910.1 dehydrogenase of unknown specificity, short-chain alcohol dehydrogenase like [Actinoalloteichus sp. GBA129-24]
MTVAERSGLLLDTLLDRTVLGGYPRWGLALRRRLPGWQPDPAPDALAGRSAIVTGANSGLGKATAAGLTRLGARVHLLVRDPAKGERTRADLAAADPTARLRVWRCDVADLDDVRRFVEEFRRTESTLDILVHNAGVLPEHRRTTERGDELTLATHVLGPLLMTESLRPELRAAGAARVIWVSSGGMYAQPSPVVDPEYNRGRYRGAAAYARSKRIQVTLLPVLARRWSADGIAVYAMHPGWVDTPGIASALPGFHRRTLRVLRTAEQGADTTVWLAAVEPRPVLGRFWHDRRARPVSLLPWTRETAAQRQSLWEFCARAVDLEP